MMLNKQNRKYMADVSLVVFAILQGSAFVVGKDALSSMTPMFLLAFRFSIASFFFVCVLI